MSNYSVTNLLNCSLFANATEVRLRALNCSSLNSTISRNCTSLTEGEAKIAGCVIRYKYLSASDIQDGMSFIHIMIMFGTFMGMFLLYMIIIRFRQMRRAQFFKSLPKRSIALDSKNMFSKQMRLIVSEQLRRVSGARFQRRQAAESAEADDRGRVFDSQYLSQTKDRGLYCLSLFQSFVRSASSHHASFDLGPGETLRAFIARLCSAYPAVPANMAECGFHPFQFVELYERCRFSDAEVTEHEFAAFNEVWRRLFLLFGAGSAQGQGAYLG